MPPKRQSRRRKNKGTQADDEGGNTTTATTTTTTTQATVDDGVPRKSKRRGTKGTIQPGAEKVYVRRKKTQTLEEKSVMAPSVMVSKPASTETKDKKSAADNKILDPEEGKRNCGSSDPADMTPKQIENLRAFVQGIQATGVQGLMNEYESIKGYEFSPFTHDCFDKNTAKNRYKDKMCLDASRVILQDGLNGDYIHANYVHRKPILNKFIATQGPIESTIPDFWRMCVQDGVGYILMLCDFVELGKDKCARYLPATVGETMNFKDISVKLEAAGDEDWYVRSKLLVTAPGKGKRYVCHIRWKDWPDHGVPQNAMPALRLLRHARQCIHPTVVHCSAGVGRTGTLIAIEWLLQKICTSSPPYDMKEMLIWLRNQRSHAIQTAAQYVFIAFVCFRLLIDKDRSLLGALNTFQAEMNALGGAKVEVVKKAPAK